MIIYYPRNKSCLWCFNLKIRRSCAICQVQEWRRMILNEKDGLSVAEFCEKARSCDQFVAETGEVWRWVKKILKLFYSFYYSVELAQARIVGGFRQLSFYCFPFTFYYGQNNLIYGLRMLVCYPYEFIHISPFRPEIKPLMLNFAQHIVKLPACLDHFPFLILSGFYFVAFFALPVPEFCYVS